MNARAAAITQAARGPVMLITIGALFALHQTGVLSIWRSWPLILIVLGIMKLIERLLSPHAPPVAAVGPYASAPYPPPPPTSAPPYGGRQ